MRQIPKTELSPDNGAIIDTKWKVARSVITPAPPVGTQESSGGSFPAARSHRLRSHRLQGRLRATNLSFHFLGDFWNDRISSLIVVSGIWRFYRDEYYKGDHWDLGPGFYECFFKKLTGRMTASSSFRGHFVDLTLTKRPCEYRAAIAS